jgi:hypothetical protein
MVAMLVVVVVVVVIVVVVIVVGLALLYFLDGELFSVRELD